MEAVMIFCSQAVSLVVLDELGKVSYVGLVSDRVLS